MQIQMTSSVLEKWEAEEEQEEGRITTSDFYSWTEAAVVIPLLEPNGAIPLSEPAVQEEEDL